MSDFKTIHLRIYKSKGRSRDILKKSNGEIANENQKVTLLYNSMEWGNFLIHMKQLGICKVDVLGFYNESNKLNTDGSFKLDEAPESIGVEIESYFRDEDVELTPDQKRIAELEAQNKEMMSKMEAVMAGGNGVAKEPKKEVDSELRVLRTKYTKLNNGTKGSPKWDVETLKVKINELSNQN